MEKFPDNFCILPWISAIVPPTGGVGVCCVSSHARLDEGMNESNLGLIRQNETSKAMRRQLLNGEWPKACEFCKKNSGPENRGHDMRRMVNEKYGLTENYAPSAFTEEPFDLQELELNFGNICNFKCRMCSAQNSSKWITDAQLLNDERFQSMVNLKVHKGEIDVTQLVPFTKNLKLLQVKGGEPFLHPQFKKLLKELVANGTSKTCALYVIINGSIYDEELLDLIQQFNTGHIAISIDGIDPIYSYIREGSAGIDAISKQIHGVIQHPRLYFSFNFAFQIYNMLTVYDATAFFYQYTDHIVLLPVMQDFLHFRNAPQEIKNDVEAQLVRILTEFKLTQESFERYNSALQNLREPRSEEQWKNFVEYTTRLDVIRGQDFLKLEPRFKPYFDAVKNEMAALWPPTSWLAQP